MKILLYINHKKDPDGKRTEMIKNALIKQEISCDIATDDFIPEKGVYSALMVLGGDGTLLRRTEYSYKFDLPIFGINAGKLGFLTEFELSEIDDAVSLLKSGKLIKDERATLKIKYGGRTYYALNDATVSRVYDESDGMIVYVDVMIDGKYARKIIGDGVTVSTPTGSTGYSLSAGGSIILSGINAFCVTPVCAHSLSRFSVVYSSDSVCDLKFSGGSKAGLFIDGKFVGFLSENELVSISRAEKDTVFLRKQPFDLFKRLNLKLQDR